MPPLNAFPSLRCVGRIHTRQFLQEETGRGTTPPGYTLYVPASLLNPGGYCAFAGSRAGIGWAPPSSSHETLLGITTRMAEQYPVTG
jgi:hypothetical protein